MKSATTFASPPLSHNKYYLQGRHSVIEQPRSSCFVGRTKDPSKERRASLPG